MSWNYWNDPVLSLLVKTSPSFADAAMGRIAQGTKVLAEGGYEKIFRQTFETVPEEQLQNSYACYLSTSAGPVMGILYVSTAKLAFCSDNPLSYKSSGQTEWSYYKVFSLSHIYERKVVWKSSLYLQSMRLCFGLYLLPFTFTSYRHFFAQ